MALPIPVLVLGLLMMHLGPGLMLYAGSPTERVGLAPLWFFALLIWGSIAAMGGDGAGAAGERSAPPSAVRWHA